MSALPAPAPCPSIASLTEAAARRRIEQDLHDGAQNVLVAMRLKLGLAADCAAELGAPELHRMLIELGDEAQLALDGVRSIARGACPPLLAVRGLADALRAEGDRAAIAVRVAGGAPRSTPEAEAAVYYCCLEALQNAAKHAGPGARVTIRLACSREQLRFAVEDDGRGFDGADAARAGGLAHMRERVAAAGGELLVASRPGRGTAVGGRVPWPPSPASGDARAGGPPHTADARWAMKGR
ncbi:MAG TPA: ATP-binding protein [Conexibacter sp.]|nr:ATP-binding protein [Conexibacter sp.]